MSWNRKKFADNLTWKCDQWQTMNWLQNFTTGSGRYLPRVPGDGAGAGDHLSVSRTLCGALIFPTIASLVGRLLFQQVSSSLQRTVLVSFPFSVKCKIQH